MQTILGATDNHGVIELDLTVSREPDIAGHGVPSKDERSYGRSAEYVEQRRIAPPVRGHVDARKIHAVGPGVVVDRQVGKALVSTGDCAASDEVGREHVVASVTRYVVDPIRSEEQAAPEEPETAIRLDHCSTDDSSVLITVAGEQVLFELHHHRPRNPEAD